MMGPSAKQREQWQAEDDARIMAQYQEILDDKPRLRRAVKQAKKEEENLNKRAKAMGRAAGVSSKEGK